MKKVDGTLMESITNAITSNKNINGIVWVDLREKTGRWTAWLTYHLCKTKSIDVIYISHHPMRETVLNDGFRWWLAHIFRQVFRVQNLAFLQVFFAAKISITDRHMWKALTRLKELAINKNASNYKIRNASSSWYSFTLLI